MPINNVKGQKKELRLEYKRIRANCAPALKQSLDQKLTERFLQLEAYKNCRTLFSYVSSPIECDTYAILKQAFADGKRVAVPKVMPNSPELSFFYIRSLDDLKPGWYNIMEPDPKVCELAEDVSDGLCLVPGLGFDMEGYRLGFGKGFYDRFLNRFGGVTAGICYSKCTRLTLPRGSFDRPIDILITEKLISFITREG